MKKSLIIVVIVLVAGLAFWLFREDQTPATMAPDPVTEPAAPEQTAPEPTAPEETAPLDAEPAPADDPAQEPLPEDDATLETPIEPESVIDQAREDADAAAEAAEAAIAEILEAQEEAAADAEAAAQAAIDEAMASSDEAAAEADETVGQAEQSIREQIAATEPEADTMTQPATADPELQAAEAEGVFTVEGFDFDRAMEAIENANLDPINMSAARAILESVRDDPEALEAALTQLRDMLGLEDTSQ